MKALRLYIAICILLLLTCFLHGQGYYVLASSGIGKPVFSGDTYSSKYSFPISVDWFFNEFRIPGIHGGYEQWRLQAEDDWGNLQSISMSFIELGGSWSLFQSRFLGLSGGWIFPLNIPGERFSNTSGPKGPYLGIFFLADFDPYWLELGFKKYLWRGEASFGTYRTPEMWVFKPPGAVVYLCIHYNLFYYWY